MHSASLGNPLSGFATSSAKANCSTVAACDVRILHVISNHSQLPELFAQRSHADGDYWMVGAEDREAVGRAADRLSMDIDDQVYFYYYDDDADVRLVEAYKIRREFATATVLDYGTWSGGQGLNVSDMDIWQRRKDMQVGSGFFGEHINYWLQLGASLGRSWSFYMGPIKW